MQFELFSQDQDIVLIAGVDEAGRGPLCGDVYAAAVILDNHHGIEGLTDSKKISEKKRYIIAEEIKKKAKAWCIASASVEEIDQLNILQATFLAMKRAVDGLSIQPQLIRVDGNQNPKFPAHFQCETIVKGDLLHEEISAASILAKTARDLSMIELDKQYPDYGFAKHKGYGTKVHMEAIQTLGVLDVHRRSFSPIQKALSMHKV
ncbi:ribonuclease HII [Wohlfahrtiimonas larvae]|uniref:Ribonuclease HII n=1 Tax=Wohlfahrtiimonas larvae TaxID=1157986 RepID=A0ABP9MKH5_9GAMM|nr:ribonuclease HII [Wohlfahrtiimonas larvae]